jgi:hypothetical protein
LCSAIFVHVPDNCNNAKCGTEMEKEFVLYQNSSMYVVITFDPKHELDFYIIVVVEYKE